MSKNNSRLWRGAVGALVVIVVLAAVWLFVPRIPPYATVKRVRQVTGLPVPLTAHVLQSQLDHPRLGAKLIEFYELQLTPDQFQAVVKAAGMRSFQRLAAGDAANPAPTNGWYHEEGSPSKGGFSRTILDAATHRVRLMVLFT